MVVIVAAFEMWEKFLREQPIGKVMNEYSSPGARENLAGYYDVVYNEPLNLNPTKPISPPLIFASHVGEAHGDLVPFPSNELDFEKDGVLFKPNLRKLVL